MALVRKILLFGLVIGAILAFAYARLFELRNLRVRHYLVGLPSLDPQLEGLRVAFLSDFHVNGPGVESDLARRAIEVTLQEEPDLVLLGGDYFDSAKSKMMTDAFDGLTSFEHVFGVLGNHDFRYGDQSARAVADVLEQRGVCVLRNSAVSVRIRDRDVTIVGVDDPYLERDDVDRALVMAREEATRPLIFMAHAPTLVSRLPVGIASLVLCGHTHGGQVRLSPV